MRWRPILVLGLLATAGCQGEPMSRPAIGATHAQEIRVTGDGGRGPAECRPDAVGRTVSDFLERFSRGDPAAADLFSETMEWYSMTEWSRDRGKRHFVTSEQAELRAYVTRRADRGERMVLLEISVQFDPPRDLAHIQYAIQRTADDLEPSRPVTLGKGAVDCSTGRILLLSMSHDARFQRTPPTCPGTAEPPDVALACAV